MNKTTLYGDCDIEGVLSVGSGANKKTKTALLSEKAPVANQVFTGDIVTSTSKPNGGIVFARITNTGASGFSSYYFCWTISRFKLTN